MNRLPSIFAVLTTIFCSTTFALEVKQPPLLTNTEPVYLYNTSLVGNNSLMIKKSGAHPIFRLEKAVVPRSWRMQFMGGAYASLPISWSQGDKWTTVLDRFSKLHNVNTIIDGGKKTVLVGPSNAVRSSGVILTTSLSPVAQKRYQLTQAYASVQQANHVRLMQVAEKEKRDKLAQLNVDKNKAIEPLKKTKEIESRVTPLPSSQSIASLSAHQELSGQEMNGTGASVKSKEYQLEMTPDFLKGQLTRYISQFNDVEQLDFDKPTQTIWMADENIKWPNDFIIKGKSELHVLNDVIKSYNLIARVKKNNIVIITEGK